MRYLCTFGSGWEEVIEDIFKKKFKDTKVIYLSNGIIIFESSKVIDVRDLFFTNNVYLLLESGICYSDEINDNISFLIKNINIDYNSIKKNIDLNRNKSFKILAINGNQPAKVDYRNLSNIENEIEYGLGLRVSKEKHDLDFLFLQRNDGKIYFLLKLTYNRITEKQLEKGSLRPEVAYLLSYIANIKENDIVFDPFTGSAAIPKIIMKRIKYNMMFASELNVEKFEKLKKEYKGNNKHFYLKNFDALDLSFFNDDFIDVIVTDPPWNIFNHDDSDYVEFYYKMLLEMIRIVKPGGRISLLMGNENDFNEALNKVEKLNIEKKLHVLVNGKKATVYLFKVI